MLEPVPLPLIILGSFANLLQHNLYTNIKNKKAIIIYKANITPSLSKNQSKTDGTRWYFYDDDVKSVQLVLVFVILLLAFYVLKWPDISISLILFIPIQEIIFSLFNNLFIQFQMSSKSQSVERSYRREEKRQVREGRQNRQDPDSHKIFLTNLNGDMSQQQVESEVRKLFQKYGQVTKLSLKKHKNGYYYFGFLQFPKGFQAYEAVKALDQYNLFGKNMKVRQDRQSQGCFYCKRMGHFARQCPQNRGRRRSYSNQRRSRDRYERRRDDRHDRYDRRQRDQRDYRERDRYERGDRGRYQNQRDNDRQRDRHRHQKRRHRERSYSDSRSSSQSSYRRQQRKDKKRRQQRKRSRS